MDGQTGLIHIYCGDGKGKTTAAMGLAMRAAGSGMKVALVQFLKGQQSSELKMLQMLPNVTIIREQLSPKFTFQMNSEELADTKMVHSRYLNTALKLAKNGECDLLILDELVGALNCGLIDEDLLHELVEKKPAQLELVMTGRNPAQWLVDAADYVSEIRKIKHPYDKGVDARKGIER